MLTIDSGRDNMLEMWLDNKSFDVRGGARKSRVIGLA